MNIRLIKGCFAAAAIGLSLSVSALASEYPERPVRLIVPAATGGGTHLTAQLLAEKMSISLGQPVIVEARPGAGGNVGAELVARSAPDGYTLLFATIGTHATNKTLYRKLPFDPVADFEPVSLVVQYPLVLVVNPSLPVRSVADLAAYIRARPGAIVRASSGNGTSTHLAGEMFVQLSGLDSPHAAYKGSSPALTDLMGNHVQYMFDSMISAMPFVEGGKLRALATTGKTRAALAPDVPTMIESGLPGFQATGWTGIVAPARTPRAIVMKLNAAIRAALSVPDVRENLRRQAAETMPSTPEEFAAFAKAETERWARTIHAANISPE